MTLQVSKKLLHRFLSSAEWPNDAVTLYCKDFADVQANMEENSDNLMGLCTGPLRRSNNQPHLTRNKVKTSQLCDIIMTNITCIWLFHKNASNKIYILFKPTLNKGTQWVWWWWWWGGEWLILLNKKQDRLINQNCGETKQKQWHVSSGIIWWSGGSLSMLRLALAWPSLSPLCWSERNGQHKELVEAMRTQPTLEL